MEEIEKRFTELQATLKDEKKKVWIQKITGQANYGHAEQPFPRTAQPFGTGISECSMFMILVEGSCPVGQTFQRGDETKWSVAFSETTDSPNALSGERTLYWIAIEVDDETPCTHVARSSHDLAVETVMANMGPETAALLEKMRIED